MRRFLGLLVLLAACGGVESADDDDGVDVDATPGATAPVHVVLFTHIEDNTPGGTIGSTESRAGYLRLRASLIAIAQRAAAHQLQWTLQPDWKYLEAARVYEDAETTAGTNGKNLFRYLREDLGVVIDPHSHENGGYNYTDVAYLLEQAGVGGSSVIGGHIWDPSLTQFQAWDRFRAPVAGERYPQASWRGDILIGAGTPNHVNDPLVSGLWRPRDRDHYFEDDPAGNIVSIGSWHDDVAGVEELVAVRSAGMVPADAMLTASWNIRPTDLLADGGIDAIDSTVLAPIAAMRDEGTVIATDFETLVATWQTAGAEAYLYQP